MVRGRCAGGRREAWGPSSSSKAEASAGGRSSESSWAKGRAKQRPPKRAVPPKRRGRGRKRERQQTQQSWRGARGRGNHYVDAEDAEESEDSWDEFEAEESESNEGSESSGECSAPAGGCAGSSESDRVYKQLLQRGAEPAIVGKRKCEEVEMELFTPGAAQQSSKRARRDGGGRQGGHSASSRGMPSFFESFFGL
mmetsp:Transcript_65304/g.142261  ORF Transcript_65304/g.142261 Transcript_65304/m.142261 type:complete len:196 (+) Transcript_65304:40-627(+)